MSNLLNINFRTGSLISKEGVTFTNNGAKFKTSAKGIGIDSQNQTGSIVSDEILNIDIGLGDITYEFNYTLKGFNNYGSSFNTFFAFGNLSGGGFGCYFTENTNIRVLGAIIPVGSNKLKGTHNCIITRKNSTVSLYFDGLLIGSEYVEVDVSNDSDLLYILQDLATSRRMDGSIQKLVISDHAYTQAEIDQSVKEFNYSFPLGEKKRNFYYPKPTDLSSEIDGWSVTSDGVDDYFDTGITVDPINDDIVLYGRFTALISANQHIGCGDTTNDRRLYFGLNSSNAWIFGYANTSSTSGVGDTDFHKFEVRKGGYFYIDNVLIKDLSGFTNSESTFTFFINSLNLTGSPINYSNFETVYANIKGIEFWGQSNGTLIDSNGVTYTNQGTGTLQSNPQGLVAAYTFDNTSVQDGTLVDVSGNGNNGVIDGAQIVPDGMKFDKTNYISLPNTITGKTPISVLMRCSILDTGSTKALFSFGGYSSVVKGLLLTVNSSNQITVFVSNESSIFSQSIPTSINTSIVNNYGMVWSGLANEDIYIYLNGNLFGSITPNIDWVGESTIDKSYIHSYNDGTFGTVNSVTEGFKIYNKALTQQDAIDYHNKWAKQHYLKDTFKYDAVGNIPLEWNQGTGVYEVAEKVINNSNLPLNYNFEEGDVFWNKNANWSIDDINNVAVADGTSNADLNQGQTEAEIGKQYYIEFKVKSISQGGFKIVFGGATTSNAQLVAGIYSEVITAISTDRLRVRADGAVDAAIGEIDYVKVFEYNPLNLVTGQKILKCITAGTIATSSKQAYGEWKFGVNKLNPSSELRNDFILDNKRTNNYNGYSLWINTSEAVYLSAYNNGVRSTVFRSNINYIQNNVNYKILIQRLQSDGKFKLINHLIAEDTSYGDFENGLVGVLNSGDSVSTWSINSIDPINGNYDGLLSTTVAGTLGNRPKLQFGEDRISGQKRKVSFKYKVNSGICYLSYIMNGSTLSTINKQLIGNGVFEHELVTDGTIPLNIYFDGTNTFNIQLDDIKEEITYPTGTFAAFIKGGLFGENWTLIDTTGGSGFNPVTDNTYTESEYVIVDNDAGDEVYGLEMRKGITQ